MKRTKSMVYTPSPEAKELYLCTINNKDVYSMICAVKTNLHKKAVKGIYDSERAIEAWYYVAEAEAKVYAKYFGYKFTVTEKWTAAVDLEEAYRDEVYDGV